MKKTLNALLFILSLIPFTAQAAFVEFIAQTSSGPAGLDGLSERPTPNNSNATGSATMVLNDQTREFTWVVSFSGLTGGAATLAHFHGPAGFGTAAGIQVDIDGTGDDMDQLDVAVFATGAGSTAGTFIGRTTITENQANDLLAGQWYINIHNAEFPGGEIRGQAVRAIPAPIPLPAAFWLFASGFLGIFARFRMIRR